MHRIALSALVLLVSSGCIPTDSVGSLIAAISVNVTSGTAPLTVMLSASSSAGGSDLALATWDFGDGSTGTGLDTSHTFTAPGRYTITVTVEDTAGATAMASQSVQVQGTTPTAVATASVTAGNAPLGVLFDGTASSAPDDVIDDWQWDFGDGETARGPTPNHIYTRAGTFTATLVAVTSGGVSSAPTTVTVEVGDVVTGSLQFNGAQFATLPLASAALSAWTFECNVFPTSNGGTVLEFGAPNVAVEVDVDDRLIRVLANALTGQLSTGEISSGWHHLAVVYNGTSVEVYFDGAALGTIGIDASTTATDLVLGQGYTGNIAQVRFWDVARTAAEIASTLATDPDPGATGLLGNWRLDEGSGQALANDATGGLAGLRGSMVDAEAADPAWSSSGP